MSAKPACLLPKKIGFLIKIDGEECSGIPDEFVDPKESEGQSFWTVRSAQDGDQQSRTLPILWNDTKEKTEVYRRKKREKQDWREEGFIWYEITDQQADLLLSGSAFAYVPVGSSPNP